MKNRIKKRRKTHKNETISYFEKVARGLGVWDRPIGKYTTAEIQLLNLASELDYPKRKAIKINETEETKGV